MFDVNKVIEIATKEIGYLEKKSNSMLEDKTANAGQNNFTKYGLAQGCNGQPWCDAFVDWCFIQAYGKEAARALLCGFSNYTPTSAGYFIKNGLYAATRPEIGDVVFFRNSSRICHTGIVVGVDSRNIYTIEGNTNAGNTLVANGGGVARKSYILGYSRIAGYGRPNYTGSDTPTIYKGCKGIAVGKLQKLLNDRFPAHKIVVDNDFGNNTMNKLVETQAMLGITHSGICDSATWNALSKV